MSNALCNMLGWIGPGIDLIEVDVMPREQLALVGDVAYVARGTTRSWIRRIRRSFARAGTHNRWGARRVPLLTR